MEKRLEEVLKESRVYEPVGILSERFFDIRILRASIPEGKVYYYYAFVGNGLEGDMHLVEVLDKRRKRKEGYPTPAFVEEFILREIAEGAIFYLSLREKYKSTEKVGGKTLKDWYEDFLRFFETVQGKSLVWHTYDEIQENLFLIELKIPKNEWPDYWALTVWERVELIKRFEKFTSAIWKLIWALIEKVALKLEEQQGKTSFTLQDIVEFLERRKPSKTIQTIYNMLKFEKSRMDKEEKEWVLSIIWQKLLEAAKEDKELTLYDIDVYFGYEEEEEEG
jgi:hypothetical protein